MALSFHSASVENHHSEKFVSIPTAHNSIISVYGCALCALERSSNFESSCVCGQSKQVEDVSNLKYLGHLKDCLFYRLCLNPIMLCFGYTVLFSPNPGSNGIVVYFTPPTTFRTIRDLVQEARFSDHALSGQAPFTSLHEVRLTCTPLIR